MRKVLVGIVWLSLSGCAHFWQVVDNQSIETDSIDEAGHRVQSISGDRRLVRTTASPTKDAKYLKLQICAETQADAITQRSEDAALSITGKGSVTDSIDERLTLTYARTELSDVVRQLSWQLCNANMNGTIGDIHFANLMADLQDRAMTVMMLRAGMDQKAALDALKKKQDDEITRVSTEITTARSERIAAWKKRRDEETQRCRAAFAGDPSGIDQACGPAPTPATPPATPTPGS